MGFQVQLLENLVTNLEKYDGLKFKITFVFRRARVKLFSNNSLLLFHRSLSVPYWYRKHVDVSVVLLHKIAATVIYFQVSPEAIRM